MCQPIFKSLFITHARLAVILVVGLCGTGGWFVAAQSAAPARSPSPVASSSQWDQPLHGSWQQQSLRQITDKISENNGVAILLDRRIDPDQELNHSAAGKSLQEELTRLAEAVHQQEQRIGETAYFGPPASAALVRTLMALRTEEITKSPDVSVRKGWLDPLPFAWPDLETPRQILASLMEPLGITCLHEELIPHDQWRGVKLQGLNRTEILSLILIQWDLTFEPNLRKKEITLVKVPASLELKREYTISNAQVSAGIKAWQEQLPGLQLQLRGNKVTATGLLEDHERFGELLQPGAKPRKAVHEPVPIERRRFTLAIRSATVRQLMQELQKSGIEFVYDAKQLEEQGINLDRNVAVDVKELAPQEFFDKIFKPLRLKVKIAGLKVELTPQ